jgi:hypothetical protein
VNARRDVGGNVLVGSAEGCSEILSGASAGIDEPSSAEILPGNSVHVDATALLVGSHGAADIRTFIPVDSQPAEVVEGSVGVFGPAAVGIEVLHTHD